MRSLNCPPLKGIGCTKRAAPTENFDSEAMIGRTHAKEAAVAPAMNAGPKNGEVGPISSGRTGRSSESPIKSFLEPAE